MLEIVCLLACLHGAPDTPALGDYYVDPAGDDQNAGTRDAPFLTLHRARDEVRKRIAKGLDCDLRVVLREGTHVLGTTLVFGPEDSGNAIHSVTYMAEPGEKVVLSGGRRLLGWKKAEGKVWQCDVPAARKGQWLFRSLYVDGRPRPRARTPNTGYHRIDGGISQAKPLRLRFRGTDVSPEWAGTGDVEVAILLDESTTRRTIREVQAADRTAVLSGDPQPWYREPDARYWIENAPDGLDLPGEWRLDSGEGRVSYWPLDGEDMTEAEVIAPRLTELVRIEGVPQELKLVRNLRFLDLGFAHTDWPLPPDGYSDLEAPASAGGALRAVGAVSCTIERCRFELIGTHAVELGQGCQENVVLGNTMEDLGAGGLRLGTQLRLPNQEDLTVRNIVSDNHIVGGGRVYPSAPGIWVGEAGENTIANNEIERMPHTGMWLGCAREYGESSCRGNKVRFNRVHHIGGAILGGSSGIFTRGPQGESFLQNNVVHDIVSQGHGGWGIRHGDGTSDILDENNLVWRCKAAGLQVDRGRAIVVRNNVFAMNSESQIARLRSDGDQSLVFERNVVYWSEGSLLSGRWEDGRFRFDRNVYWLTGGRGVTFGARTLDEWRRQGQDRASVVKDPLFVNVARGDFSLRAESPAPAVGFQEIPIQFVGPRDGYRLRVVSAGAAEAPKAAAPQ